MRYEIKSEKISVTVDTLGAEVVSAVGTDGFEYIWSGEAWSGHAPLLFPLCGSILGDRYTLGGKEYSMKKHGFTRRSEFKVEGLSEGKITLSLEPSEAIFAQYPFDFKLTAEYTVEGDRLDCAFTIENRTESVMPYMFGWHPAFNLGGDAPISSFEIDFGVEGPLKRRPLKPGEPFITGELVDFPLDNGKYALNEDEIYPNDTLILLNPTHRARLFGNADSHTVEISYSDNLPYFCIWKAPLSSARYICLEPWTGTATCGDAPENFDTRVMERLAGNGTALYTYSVTLA